jgi:hypothetical protein
MKPVYRDKTGRIIRRGNVILVNDRMYLAVHSTRWDELIFVRTMNKECTLFDITSCLGVWDEESTLIVYTK